MGLTPDDDKFLEQQRSAQFVDIISEKLSALSEKVEAANLLDSTKGPLKVAYTTPGTYDWEPPAGYSFARMRLRGAGAGGGSGRLSGSNTNRRGGSAGGGGQFIERVIRLSDYTLPVSLVIGQKGIGGAAQVTSSTDGNPGTDGGDTTFGTYFKAAGGKAGLGGNNGAVLGGQGGNIEGETTPVATAGLNAYGEIGANGGDGTIEGGSSESGGAGGGGTTLNSTAKAGGSSSRGGPGAGAGGGSAAGNNTPQDAGSGGKARSYAKGGGAIGGTSGVSPTAGDNGADSTDPSDHAGDAGGGGGGGIAAGNTAGMPGGNGGFPSAGGAGGGAGTGTGPSGKGGDGGDGYAEFLYF